MGDVTLTGSIVYDGPVNAGAIVAHATTNLLLDAQVHTLSGQPCHRAFGSAVVTEGPNYQCIQDSP